MRYVDDFCLYIYMYVWKHDSCILHIYFGGFGNMLSAFLVDFAARTAILLLTTSSMVVRCQVVG